MSEKADEVFGLSHKSSEKFDYFLCSVSGALFAYIAQTFTPQRLDNPFSALQTASLLFLAISFYAGIRRIQYRNAMIRENHVMLANAEHASKLTELLSNPGDSFRNKRTGKNEDRQTVQNQHQVYVDASNRAAATLQFVRTRAKRHGKAQVVFLLVGFLTIFSAKVLQPYQLDFLRHTNAIDQTTNRPAQSIADTQASRISK